MEERFDLVDLDGNVVGSALRSEVHGNPDLIHRAVHVFVVNAAGELFLQKRSHTKDVQPGKWDTSVGGHVDAGESPGEAAIRETREELGIEAAEPVELYELIWRSDIETELIRSYKLLHEGPFVLHPDEIEEGRFWSLDDIEASMGQGVFTPNFEWEWRKSRPALGM